jgi:hypothetical protein
MLLLGLVGGCVERTLTIQSTPPGALVTMNDQEVGRTPLSRRFVWYGYYDVQVRKEGYQTLNTTTSVVAPWWQWVPLDFVTELLPLHFEDSHVVSYKLQPLSTVQIDPQSIVDRGEALRERLESGHPTTPKAKPATRPATQRK